MGLEFLKDSPEQAFRKIATDLRYMNPDLDLRRYARMPSDKLVIESIHLSALEQTMVDSMPYGKWLTDAGYMENKILQEALSFLIEHKRVMEAKEVLVPGYTYYRAVKQFGNSIQGELCHFMSESQIPVWAKFSDSAPIMKALEVLRYGGVDDFRRIYVECADGRPDGLTNLSVRHITESSNAALNLIEEYCDSRWDGAWPWEMTSPYKLHKMIEEDRAMKTTNLQEMHEALQIMLTKLIEGESDKFEVMSFVSEMSNKISGMIENLARLAGEGIINLKVKARSSVGDAVAMQMDHQLTPAINAAADSLSKLKVTIDHIMDELNASIENTPVDPNTALPADPTLDGGIMPNPMAGGQPGMEDPNLEPPVEGEPVDDDLTDQLDVEPERAKKGA